MMRGWALCLAAASAALSAPALAQSFTDVTAASGIDYEQFTGQSPYLGEEYFMTGGAAAADVDDDGWVDLYVTRMVGIDVLYHNTGGGVFTPVPPGISGLNAGDGSNGAVWGDVDADGDLDLYVTTVGVGRNFMYVNEGGTFTEQAVARGAAVPRSSRNPVAGTFSATFGDYDGDGFLDLHVCAWNDRGGEGSRLLRNLGSQAPGTFVDVTATAGVSLNTIDNTLGIEDVAFAFTSQFADLDQDGHLDLVVAGDFRTSRVFWNDGDGTFTDGTDAANFGTDENGMGLALGDADGDGFLDVFVTSIFDPLHTCRTGECTWGDSGNRLYRYDGSRAFSDWTGPAAVADGGWGWGAAFLDADRDMDADLVMTNGYDYPGWPSEDEQFHDDPMRLWGNPGGLPLSEKAQTAGLTDTGDGKALVTLDMDNDGDLDLFVVHNADPPSLFRNESTGSWLQVELRGVLSNRRGLGARIDVIAGGKIQSQLVASGGYLSDSDKVTTFGLASLASADVVRVRWPRGNEQMIFHVPANQRVLITEDLGGSTAVLASPGLPRLDSPFPNPFHPRTAFSIHLPRPGFVSLTVYDVRGRLVRRLFQGELGAGAGRFAWDGRDARGGRAAAGRYLLELRADGRRITRTVTLAR